MTEANPSYNPDACCGADCNFFGHHPTEPCWGDVHLVGEYAIQDDNYEAVHECEGHSGCFEIGEKYRQEKVK